MRLYRPSLHLAIQQHYLEFIGLLLYHIVKLVFRCGCHISIRDISPVRERYG